MLYGHGDDGYLYHKEIIADFSTNVWYGGEPEGLKTYLFQQWKSINRYPEVMAESLRKEISGFHQLSPQQVLVCNGTAEAIYLIAHAFERMHTSIVIPTFSEYEDACRLYQHHLDFVQWETLKQMEELSRQWPQSNLVFICNPNNPTGDLLSCEQIEQFLLQRPQTLFVMDEAYIAFTLTADSVVPLLAGYQNLIILRSLTKTFAIPGLRLGYVLSSPVIISQLEKVKCPWSVNTLAMEAGKFILRHYDELQPPVQALLAEKKRFTALLSKDANLKVKESYTHYFIVETSGPSASDLKKYLIDHFSILIRDAGNFRSLSPRHFRLATLTPEKNNLLTQALQAWNHTL